MRRLRKSERMGNRVGTAGGAGGVGNIDPLAADRTALAKQLAQLPPLTAQFHKDPAAIKELQARLNAKLGESAPVDGKWTPDLEAQIGRFQAKAQRENPQIQPPIAIDRKVGQQTWALLLGAEPALVPHPGIDLLNLSSFSPAELLQLQNEGVEGANAASLFTRDGYQVPKSSLVKLLPGYGGEELAPDQASAYVAMFAKANGGPPTQTSVLGVRSGTAGKANGYGDAFVVLTTDGRAFRFTGNTKPGGALGNSLSPDVNGDGIGDLGCIQPGTYKATATTYKGNLAFRVTNTNGSDGLAGMRDTRQNGTFTTPGQLTGVLFHRGGTTDPGSVGCQTLPPDQFNKLATILAKFGGGQSFTYTLVEATDRVPTGPINA